MPISNNDLAILLVNSFRYCLGRQTYAVHETATLLLAHWGVLPTAWQQLIHKEINQAITDGRAGAACDVETWRTVLSMPIPYQ